MLNTKFQRTLAGGMSLVKGFSAESVKELLEEKRAGALFWHPEKASKNEL
jgi:hypothetical protein